MTLMTRASAHTYDHADRVSDWRRRRLLAAGFGARLAGQLAATDEVDLHEILELVDRGCPPEVAARIVAPLGVDVDGC
jgi:hypothetical protein